MVRTPRALACAFALAAVTSVCASPGQAAVPSGATASPAALRQAYIDAVRSGKPVALEALFDMDGMPADTRASFRKHISADSNLKVSDVTLKDPGPTLVSDYARYNNACFPTPIVKVLEVKYVHSADGADSTEYYIGTSASRFYFVSAVRSCK